MNFKALTAAALLGLACLHAAHGAEYNTAKFVASPTGSGFELILFGFGRGAAGGQPVDSKPFSEDVIAPVPFFDSWNIDVSAMPAGTYQLAAKEIFAFGSVQFSAVGLSYLDASGGRTTLPFLITDQGKTATGSGSFTVTKPCPAKSCLWIDVYGTQLPGETPANYGAHITAQVPEPESYALLLAGLAAIGLQRRRRNRTPAA
nr:PEP-CTERM sorting domain-containing protein [uncultured Roseateles sp.]